jgi:hypothetical protein
MKNWRTGVLGLVSAAVLIGAGAGGRAAIWATPEGDGEVEAPHSTEVTVSNGRPTVGPEGGNGAARTESRRNR